MSSSFSGSILVLSNCCVNSSFTSSFHWFVRVENLDSYLAYYMATLGFFTSYWSRICWN